VIGFSKKDWVFALCFSLALHALALSAFGKREERTLIEKTPLKMSIAKIQKLPPKTTVSKVKPIEKPITKEKPAKKTKQKKKVTKKINRKTKVARMIPKQEIVIQSPQIIQAPQQVIPETIQSTAETTPPNTIRETADPIIQINYEQVVASMIAKAKRYPRSARRRNREGSGTIVFTLSRVGSVVSAKIIKSTNVKALDKEMIAMVHRTSPFPAFPENLKLNSLSLTIPIKFELK